jgi:hypothetical protein
MTACGAGMSPKSKAESINRSHNPNRLIVELAIERRQLLAGFWPVRTIETKLSSDATGSAGVEGCYFESPLTRLDMTNREEPFRGARIIQCHTVLAL